MKVIVVPLIAYAVVGSWTTPLMLTIQPAVVRLAFKPVNAVADPSPVFV